jgi:outer membrane murein-binding lipoprotein Lpp
VGAVVVSRLVVALFCCALVGEMGWLAHRAHQLSARVEALHADVRRFQADVEDLQVRVNAVEDAADGGGAP